MRKRSGSSGDSTISVHGGEREHRESSAVTTPIYQTSTFWFPDSDELKAYQEGRLSRDEYGRYGNPTWRAVERKLCELEGAEEVVHRREPAGERHAPHGRFIRRKVRPGPDRRKSGGRDYRKILCSTLSPGQMPSLAAVPAGTSRTALTGPADSMIANDSGVVPRAILTMRPSGAMKIMSRAI